MTVRQCPLLLPIALSALLLPGTAFSQVDKGIQQYREAASSDAAATLRGVLKENPNDERARAYLGLALYNESKAGEANRLVKPGASGQADQLLAARQLIEQKKFDEARQKLDKVVQAGEAENKDSLPDEAVDALVLRGRTDVEQKRFDAAVKDLDRAIEIDPRYAYAHYYAGISYSNLKRLDKMVDHFQAFLTLAPKAPEAPKVRSLMRAFQH